MAGGAVRDTVSLRVRASQPVTRVTLYADGHPVSRDATPPYRLSWDTVASTEGAHTLLVYARDEQGHRASLELPVVVANAPGFPAALTRNWATHDVVDEGGFGFVTPDR